VGAGRGDERIALRRRVPQPRPQALEVLDGLVDRARDVRRNLDDRLEQLGLEPALVLLLVFDLREDLVDAGDELVALPAEDLELLLDAQAERAALAEVLLQAEEVS
jgi:hypothetical protein